MAQIDQGRVEQLVTDGLQTAVAAIGSVAFRELGAAQDEGQAAVVSMLAVDLEDVGSVPDSSNDLTHVQRLTVRLSVRSDEAAVAGSMYGHGSLVTKVAKAGRPALFSGSGHRVVVENARQESVPQPDDQAAIRVTLVTLTGFVERQTGTSTGF